MSQDICNTLRDIIKEVLEYECEVDEEMRLVEDLDFDSVSLLYLQVAIEDAFDIRFDPVLDDFGEIFYSMKNLCDGINKKINGDD